MVDVSEDVVDVLKVICVCDDRIFTSNVGS
jgi:hypothetical protein